MLRGQSLKLSEYWSLRIHVSGIVGVGGFEDHEGALELGEAEGGVLVEGGEPVSDDLGHRGVQRLQLLVLSRNWNGMEREPKGGKFGTKYGELLYSPIEMQLLIIFQRLPTSSKWSPPTVSK